MTTLRSDPKAIWLAPECFDSSERRWCEDDVWTGECECDECFLKEPEDRAKPTKYIRADLAK